MEHEGTARSALRGLTPTVLTVAVVVGGVAGGRAGSGTIALAVAAATAVGTAAVLAGLVVVLLRRATRGGGTPRPADLAARWAEVEPVWSGRR